MRQSINQYFIVRPKVEQRAIWTPPSNFGC